MDALPQDIAERLNEFGQEHLVRWWPDLSTAQRERLAQQLRSIDFARLETLRGKTDSTEDGTADRADTAEAPRAVVRLPASAEDEAAWEAARAIGREALAAGRVGIILVAGGQGTRLGFPYPKGMFRIGPVSGHTLFQLLMEQAQAVSRHAAQTLPYYVMTSDATHDQTVAFFELHDFFGYPRDSVFFFRQGNMPAVDAESGNVLLSDRHSIAMSPDGHGGLLQALHSEGLLAQMREAGVDLLYYHQVDNPTAIVADPAFIGFHLQNESEMSTKVVRKVGPEEKMGVVVDVGKTAQIIEYSELTPEQSAKENADGEWIFWAGSTAIHVFGREFLERLATSDTALPFHQARKLVPWVDADGNRIEPDDPDNPNALKFERFIFDTMPAARNPLIVEADRAREFNPVKNREGNDSPETARAALTRIAREWLRAAGVEVDEAQLVEISPLRALNAGDLQAAPPPATYFA